jgi:hypothetical protein
VGSENCRVCMLQSKWIKREWSTVGNTKTSGESIWSNELAINYFSLFQCQWGNKYYALDGVKGRYFQLRDVIST